MVRLTANPGLLALALFLPSVAACSGGGTGADSGTKTEAGANEVDVKTQMQLTAGEYVQATMSDTFDPNQVSLLQVLAHQNAVGEQCDGFDVDNDKWAAEIGTIKKAKLDAGVDEETVDRQLLTAMGLTMGAELAIAAYDPQAYCDAARADRDDGEAGEHNIFADKTPA